MGFLNRVFEIAVWIAIIAMLWRKFEQPVQEGLVNAGVLHRRITLEDVCEWVEDCPSVHELLGCELKAKVPVSPTGAKPKLRISKKLLKKKTFVDRFNGVLNSIFLWCQSFVVPEQYRMPCLFGDCGMDQEIKRQKDILMYRDKKPVTTPPKSPLRPPKSHVEDVFKPTTADSEESYPTPHMASDDDATPKPNL